MRFMTYTTRARDRVIASAIRAGAVPRRGSSRGCRGRSRPGARARGRHRLGQGHGVGRMQPHLADRAARARDAGFALDHGAVGELCVERDVLAGRGSTSPRIDSSRPTRATAFEKSCSSSVSAARMRLPRLCPATSLPQAKRKANTSDSAGSPPARAGDSSSRHRETGADRSRAACRSSPRRRRPSRPPSAASDPGRDPRIRLEQSRPEAPKHRPAARCPAQCDDAKVGEACVLGHVHARRLVGGRDDRRG